jgi:GNAT superfamily N-acetyltransferase
MRMITMQITIRAIQKRDYETVCEMMHALWRIHAIKSKYINKRYLEEYDAHKEIRKKNKEILVASADGNVAGYAYISIKKSEDFFKFKKYLYLDEIFVDGKYRGHGIGRKLLNEVKRVARRKKLLIFARIWPFSKQMLELSSEEGGELLHRTVIFPD